MHEQRIATLAALRAEGVGTIADLHAERLGATADLRGEREKVLDALRDHEVAIVSDLGTMGEKEIQTLDTKGRDLIDHLFLRAVELMLLTLVCSVLVWILLQRFSARPKDRAERTFHRAA